jgi:transcription antitermination protein NusB
MQTSKAQFNSDEPAVPAKPKSARRRARELTIQGLYQWLLSKNDFSSIISFLEEDEDFAKADEKYLHRLLEGILSGHLALQETLETYIDRSLNELSPIEYSALLMGLYEMIHCIDVPYKVIVNEAVEVTKVFGGVDGYKYINGVLDKMAPKIRQHEKVTP